MKLTRSEQQLIKAITEDLLGQNDTSETYSEEQLNALNKLNVICNRGNRQPIDEFLCDIINYSPHGVLMWTFFQTAIEDFAQKVIENYESSENPYQAQPSALNISPTSIYNCAKEIQEKFESRRTTDDIDIAE